MPAPDVAEVVASRRGRRGGGSRPRRRPRRRRAPCGPSGGRRDRRGVAALSCRRCVLAANRREPASSASGAGSVPGGTSGEVEVVDREDGVEQPAHVGHDVGAVAQVLDGRPHLRRRARGRARRRRRPRWSAPTSAPAPAACRACPAGRTARRRTGTPRRSPRHGTGHRAVRPARSSWSWSWSEGGCSWATASGQRVGHDPQRPPARLLGEREHLAQRQARRGRRRGRRRRARP